MMDFLSLANALSGLFEFGTFVVIVIMAVELRHVKKWQDKHDDHHHRKVA